MDAGWGGVGGSAALLLLGVVLAWKFFKFNCGRYLFFKLILGGTAGQDLDLDIDVDL